MILRRALLAAAATPALLAFTPARKQLLLTPTSRVPPGLSLDLTFMTPGTLDPRITFTRASTATYFDSTGTMRTAATSAPRWDYNPSTHALNGLLIEEARTNLLVFSQDITNFNWQKSGTVTVTGTVAAPDGTVTGQTINVGAPGAGAFYQAVTGLTNGTRYEPSFWINPISTTGTLNVQNEINSANGAWQVNIAMLSPGWQRITRNHPAVTITVEFTSTSGQAGPFISAQSGTINASWWGFQMEAGAYPTSYIPTTAASVTRAQDGCIIPPASMGFFTSPGGSWYAEFNYFNTAPANNRVIGQADSFNSSSSLFIQASKVLGQYDVAAVLNGTTVTASNGIMKAASTWAVGSAKLCANGGAVDTGATLTTGYTAYPTFGVGIMGIAAGGLTTSGYIRRVRYWPRALTNAELQQVTT